MVRMFYPEEIEEFFVEITDKVKSVLNPEYILIAGSFGKGSWLFDGTHLLSDFEFEFICKEKWSLKKKKALLKELNESYPYEISLKGNLLQHVENRISSNYSTTFPGYVKLNFYDAFSDPKILYSKNQDAFNLGLRAEEVPAWEAWRLVVNRIGDILSLQIDDSLAQKDHDYYWLKIFESIADAYLILNKLYVKNISARCELWSKELIGKNETLPNLCKESFEIIRSALEARNYHDISRFDNDLFSLSKKNQTINSWLLYIEGIVMLEEGIDKVDPSFSKCYMQSKTIQHNYLEVSNFLAIPISNSIRLLFNSKALFRLNFKIYKLGVSWRHLILIVMSEIFKEQMENKDSFPETIRILGKVESRKDLIRLSDKNLIEMILKLWKILR